jgi:membrane associated rhomboid family serine protease
VTPVVRSLLIANVAVFFLQVTQPALANAFVFVPRLALIRPWSIVTYMFLHGGLMHIGFNMLALFFFGPRVEDRMGSRRFTILYFLSGISGAMLSFIFSPSAPIIGASAGVFGVMLAFAHYWPDAPIMIWGVLPVPARLLVIGTTIIALFSGFGARQSGVAHFAHLGGYAGAYLYMKWLECARGAFKRRATAAPPAAARRLDAWKSVEVAKVHPVNRDELNRILDKIGKSGLASLTEQERLFLSNFVPPDDRPPPLQ